MIKTELENGKIEYSGSLMGFDYMIIKNNDDEFEEWIKSKMIRYRMNPLEKKIYQQLLGIDKLLDRIKTLEEKIK